jgi:hypothetical protein
MARKKKDRRKCKVSINGEPPIVGGNPVDHPFLSNELAREMLRTKQLPDHATIRFSYSGVREQCCTFSWEIEPDIMAILARANARLEFCVDAHEPIIDPAVMFARVEVGIWADPDKVTAHLGVAPKTKYPADKDKSGSWWFDITDQGSHTPDLGAMCAALCNALPKNTAELCRAHKSRVWIKFSVDGNRESPDGFGFVLESQSVAQLAALGAPFVTWMMWV